MTPKGRSTGADRPGLWTNATTELLATLNLMVFEPDGPSAFASVGPTPERFAARFPSIGNGPVELAQQFPFLEYFIEDAHNYWKTDDLPARKSGLWTETDAAGQPCRLEATAVRHGDRGLLLLAIVDEQHEDIQGILQAAREHSLAFEKLEAAQSDLDLARQELENRVAARTSELVEANRKLEKEVAARERANETLLTFQTQLRALADQLTLTEERERRRIATELHDHVGQNLAVTKIHLGMLSETVQNTEAEKKIQTIRGVLEETIAYTRTLTFELAPPALYELGLEGALESLAERSTARYGLQVEFQDDDRRKDLDHNTKLILFHAVRELVHNVAKHACAQRVWVKTRRDGTDIVVTIEDDGVGFPETSGGVAETAFGFGLFNVRERMEHLGGRCRLESGPERGTRATLRAPTRKEPS